MTMSLLRLNKAFVMLNSSSGYTMLLKVETDAEDYFPLVEFELSYVS